MHNIGSLLLEIICKSVLLFNNIEKKQLRFYTYCIDVIILIGALLKYYIRKFISELSLAVKITINVL